jgi:hypothetical protein
MIVAGQTWRVGCLDVDGRYEAFSSPSKIAADRRLPTEAV